MNINKASNRDRKKRNKTKMVVDGRGYTVIEEQKRKRAQQIRKEREEKEKLHEEIPT